MNNGFDCNLPWFYQKASSKVATKDRKYRSGQLYTAELQPNAVEEVNPTRGKCTYRKMCFRENLRWSCDAGICNKRTVDQKIEQLTGVIRDKGRVTIFLDHFFNIPIMSVNGFLLKIISTWLRHLFQLPSDEWKSSLTNLPNEIDHRSESDSILQLGWCQNHEWKSF